MKYLLLYTLENSQWFKNTPPPPKKMCYMTGDHNKISKIILNKIIIIANDVVPVVHVKSMKNLP